MFLSGDEFEKLENDPTKSFQAYVQRTLLSMKRCFDKKQYKHMYPSSSRPGLYFGLAKVHKLKNGSKNVSELPLRPVISNIGTATYEISKYLAGLLQPLTKSEFTIESTKDFVNKIRGKKIDSDYELVSFDVVSLFTSVPLDYTIELILDKVYVEKVINTKLKRNEMKKLLEVCTKELHFSFDNGIYRQRDGVAMGSPLGPVLENIFMVQLEKSLVTQMHDNVPLWYRYVDDTFTFIKNGQVENVMHVLNGFHPSIKFTYEKEKDNSISFLDVHVIRRLDGYFDTDIYRKQTDTNIYLSWNSFAPRSWKVGTLKGLIRRAFTVCSTEQFRNKEISFLKEVFVTMNGFPSRVVNNTVYNVKKKIQEERHLTENMVSPTVQSIQNNVTTNTDKLVTPYISLPFKGVLGEGVISKFRDALSAALPMHVKPRFTYKGKKLGSYFRVKDQVPLAHQSDLVYAFRPEYNSNQTTEYIGETNVRFETRTYEHCVSDKKSSVYKHKTDKNLEVSQNDFVILDKGYKKVVDRKLAEALYIRDLKPKLNEQKHSYKLLLFN